MKYLIPFLVFAIGLYYFLMPKDVFVSHNCDLAQGRCVINQEGLKAEVFMKPVPLDPAKDFKFQVKFSDGSIEKVEALLIGLSFNHAPVELPIKRKTPIFYEAKTLFPVCTEQRMKWRIHLVTHIDGKKYKTNLDFEVDRD